MTLKLKGGFQEVLDKGVKLTPMMEQYFSIKKQYPDILLLFRMGDFYEVFFDDAKEASELLHITLTHRGKLGDIPIPMAGIPHHAASQYIDKLTAQGKKAAICEQVQDPKETKGIVERAVTQVVSPGLPFDIDKTEAHQFQFIVGAIPLKEGIGLVFLDYVHGDFFGQICSNEIEAVETLGLYSPREFLTYFGQWDPQGSIHRFFENRDILCTYLSEEAFSHKTPLLDRLMPGLKNDKFLKRDFLPVIGAMAYYLESTQKKEVFYQIRPFHFFDEKDYLQVGTTTLEGLEILPSRPELFKSSLLGHMNQTKTSLGSRCLKRFFCRPLKSLSSISERLSAVEKLIQDESLLESLRLLLKDVRDIERLLTKASHGRLTPQDLLALEKTIRSYQEIIKVLPKEKAFKRLSGPELKTLSQFAQDLALCLNDEMGVNFDKGNVIRAGYSEERDKVFDLAFRSDKKLEKLQEKFRAQTQIPKLRVRSNNVAGFYVEVPKAQSQKMKEPFERRQTLVNTERYTCPELKKFEQGHYAAHSKLEKIEKGIFEEKVQVLKDQKELFLKLSESLGLIDSFQALAYVSFQENFSRPIFSHEKQLLSVTQGWHPLLKKQLKQDFVPHDLELNHQTSFGLITGPNMAGKTTVMREMAIIQFLAQVGCFVPAKEVMLSPKDFLFSRLGANDNILKGQSTFMVEMMEAAEILRYASQDSLVLLDELGRGTSTYDGLSLAWAIMEYIVQEIQCLTLFSTHYHELIEVAEKLSGCENLTVETTYQNKEVQFLYQLKKGGAKQSFGIHVAKLAGLPKSVLERATQLLDSLENAPEEKNHSSSRQSEQLSFFGPSPLQEELKKIDLNQTTPLQALQKLQDLQQLQ